jgi:hypothetical protein
VPIRSDILPDVVDALKAALVAERSARQEAEARASGAEAMVAHLKLVIAKLRRERFGPSAERGSKLLDQLELQLEELEASATEDELAAKAKSGEDGTVVTSFTRKKPVRGALSRAPAARACGDPGVGCLPVPRRQARQARRGRDRDAGGGAAAMESGADRARKVRVPQLREDHPAAGPVSYHRARAGRSQPAGDDPLCQVRPSSAAQPALSD